MAGIFPSPFRPELVPCAATRRSTTQLPDAPAPRVHPRASAPSLACPAWQGKAADAPCTVVRVSPALRAMWPGVTPPPAATGRSSLHAGRGPLLSLRGGTKQQQQFPHGCVREDEQRYKMNVFTSLPFLNYRVAIDLLSSAVKPFLVRFE